MEVLRIKSEHYSLFETSLGWCGIVYGQQGVVKLYLPGMKKGNLKKNISSQFKNAVEEPVKARKIIKNVCSYFKKNNAPMDFKVDMTGMTDFQKKVYNAAIKIPFGKIKTYKWIANKIGVPAGPRAVGNALAANPVPLIIPCHRVVGCNGKLGGFSATGGLNMKKRMLALEGCDTWIVMCNSN